MKDKYMELYEKMFDEFEEEFCKEENVMKVLFIKTGELAQVRYIKGNDWKEICKVIDCDLFEVVRLSDSVCLYCDEEGKINGKRPNRALYDDNGHLIDIIFGDFIIIGDDGEGGDRGLTKEESEKWYEEFHYPQRFFKADDGILPVPFYPPFYPEK